MNSQTTVPEPPASASAVCRVGKSTVDMKKDENIDLFAATVTQEIILDLNWEVPESGNWLIDLLKSALFYFFFVLYLYCINFLYLLS